MLRRIETEDLLHFGMIPEFLGRIPVVAPLDSLDQKALVEILTKPKNALVKQYQQLLGMEGVELRFTLKHLKLLQNRHRRKTQEPEV